MTDLQTEQEFDLSIDLEWLEKAIGNLSVKEIEIIYMRYGLQGNEAKTLKAISENLNLSAERVRQIEVRALKKLRAWSGVDGGTIK